MLCPKCGSDYINYSMKKNEQGIMCMHAECQSCHYFWTYCQEISKEYFKREDIGTPKKRIEKEKICRPERKPKFNNPKKMIMVIYQLNPIYQLSIKNRTRIKLRNILPLPRL